MMSLLFLLIIILILIPIVLGPFLVKFTHWISVRARIDQVSPEILERDVREFIDQAKIEFNNLGFQFVGYMSLADYMPKIISYFGLFRHEETKVSGMAVVIRQTSDQSVKYCEFSNRYSDERIINVNNSPIMGAYRNPNKSNYRYPKISSIKHLFEINNWVTSEHNKTASLIGLDKGRELEILSDAFDSEIRLQAEYGYYVLNEDNTRYRLTWKGAIIMTEKQVFPIKQVYTFFDLLSARRVISGMPSHAGKTQ